MNATLHDRWLTLARSLSWQGDPEAVWETIYAHYAETARSYHNLKHIAACFTAFDTAPQTGIDPRTIELAIWFHDIIYQPQAKDNEHQSAELFAAIGMKAGLSPGLIAEVKELILITQHRALPETSAARLLVDIDLSILGTTPVAFAEYERQIRTEYAWVAEPDFCQGRAAVLEQFLQREHIFSTPYFHHRCEAQARVNLKTALQHWKSRCT